VNAPKNKQPSPPDFLTRKQFAFLFAQLALAANLLLIALLNPLPESWPPRPKPPPPAAKKTHPPRSKARYDVTDLHHYPTSCYPYHDYSYQHGLLRRLKEEDERRKLAMLRR